MAEAFAVGAVEAAVAEKGGAEAGSRRWLMSPGQDVEAEAAAAVGEISGDKPSPALSLKSKNKIISDF